MSPTDNAPVPPSSPRSLRWPLGIAVLVSLLGGAGIFFFLRTPEPPPAPTPAFA
ncbi:DUF3014 domain-containing protein, partial [Corallococcus terminator]